MHPECFKHEQNIPASHKNVTSSDISSIHP